MRKYVLTCLLAALPALAGIEVNESIQDVYYRGLSQTAGSISFYVSADEFPAASDLNPAYIRIAPDKGARLSETRVDLTSEDNALNRPIHLALVLDSNETDQTVGAAPGAVSIVRWVAGEGDIWLRVSQSSSTWIKQGDAALPPDENREISFTLGLSQYRATGGPTNMAWPSIREGDDEPTHSLLCLDLSQSQLTADGTLESLLNYDVAAYDAGAQTEPGVYTTQDPLEINFTGTFSIARGRDVQLEQTVLSSPAELSASLSEVAYVTSTVNVAVKLHVPEAYLNLVLGSGSQLELTLAEDSRWGIAHADLLSGRLQGEADYQNRVAADSDEAGFRKVVMTLDPPHAYAGKALDNYVVELALDLAVPTHLISGDLVLDLGTRIITWDDVPGSLCSGESYRFPEQTLTIARLEPGRILTHLTKVGNGFTTGLNVTNTGEEATNYQLVLFDESGARSQVYAGSLAPGEIAPLDVTAVTDAAYGRIEAADAVQLDLAYQLANGGGGPADVAETRRVAKRWRLKMGNDDVFDAVAFINMGDQNTDVTVIQYQGSVGLEFERENAQVALPAGAKGTFVISDHFDSLNGSYFVIEASQPMAVMALRGDLSSQYMWQNPANPID